MFDKLRFAAFIPLTAILLAGCPLGDKAKKDESSKSDKDDDDDDDKPKKKKKSKDDDEKSGKSDKPLKERDDALHAAVMKIAAKHGTDCPTMTTEIKKLFEEERETVDELAKAYEKMSAAEKEAKKKAYQVRMNTYPQDEGLGLVICLVKDKSLEAALDKAWPEVKTDAAPTPTAPAAAFAVGDRVQVQWKGAWYPAKILKVDGEKFLIHYDGYSSSWDEWVGPTRIKK